MRGAARYVISVVVIVGVGMGVASAEETTTTSSASTSSENVEAMNLDGTLTSTQAEAVAQHPKVDQFLEQHPHLAQELANHPNAARSLDNRPGVAGYFANHPEARERMREASARWEHAIPEQRTQGAQHHPKAAEVLHDTRELHRDQRERSADARDLKHDSGGNAPPGEPLGSAGSTGSSAGS